MNTTFRKMYTPEEIKAIAGGGGAGLEVIEITGVPTTSTSGTLNEAQMAIVNSDTPSCVKFNNEYYYKNDDNHTDGITVYTHTGYTETDGGSIIKYFSITLATSAWTLTTKNVSGKLYMHKVVFKALYGTGKYFYIMCDFILPTSTKYNSVNDYFNNFKDNRVQTHYICNLCNPSSDIIPDKNKLIISTFITVDRGDSLRQPVLHLWYKNLESETWLTDDYKTTTLNLSAINSVAVIQL